MGYNILAGYMNLKLPFTLISISQNLKLLKLIILINPQGKEYEHFLPNNLYLVSLV